MEMGKERDRPEAETEQTGGRRTSRMDPSHSGHLLRLSVLMIFAMGSTLVSRTRTLAKSRA